MIIVDQPIERHLNGDEGGRGLRQFAKRHAAGEIFRHAQKPAENRREQEIGLRDERRAHQLPEQLPPAQQHLRQRVPNDALSFDIQLARRVVAGLADLVRRRQKFRLALALHLNDRRQVAADREHEASEKKCVDDRADDKISWNGHHQAPNGNCQAAADRPEHTGEDSCCHHRIDQTQRQINRRIGGRFDVVGDSVFAILIFARRCLQLAIVLIGEPKAEGVGGQPLPPFALCCHTRPHRNDGQRDTRHGQRRKHEDLAPQGIAVATG